jgi:hypothetical protein
MSLFDNIPRASLDTWFRVLTFLSIGLPIVGAMMGGFCGWGAFKVSNRISDLQGANLQQIQQRLAVRNLTDQQRSRVVSQLRQFAGQEFQGAIASGLPDGRIIWEALCRALQTAGWKMVPPSSMGFGDPPAAVPISPTPGISLFSSSTRKADTGAAARALASALKAEGIAADAIVGDFGDQASRPEMIEIVIGPKPEQ